VIVKELWPGPRPFRCGGGSQFRAQTVVAAAALAVFAVIFGLTGPHLAQLYDASGLATCHAHGDCSTLTSNFLSQVKSDGIYPVLYFLGTGVLLIAPAIVGAFWGAPLVTRELEAGAFRLAWNQSVTLAGGRRRLAEQRNLM
jgi:hypothetical protein